MGFLPLILNPWPQRGILFILGALGALAFAPLCIFPAIVLAFSGVWFLLNYDIEQKSSSLKIFLLGWWFGLGHFTVGLYWVAHALTVDLATFWWLIPFALFGVPSILAVFTGAAFLLTRFWPYSGISRAFVFAAIWVGFEWLRGHLFTGFPWNLAGYTWVFSSEMLQMTSLVGIYGLSLLVLLIAISLEYLFGKDIYARNIVFCIYLLTILCWVWGKGRLDHPNVLDAPSIAIRIVQPSIPQTLKWDPVLREANFQDLLHLTKAPATLPLKAILWPETAVPFFLEQDNFRRTLIAESMPQGALLFTGALRRTSPEDFWNSLLVLDSHGDIVAFYDKSHLVPFGEYLPYRQILDSLFGKGSIKKITAGTIDFKAGSGLKSIPLPQGFPTFSGLVCYEVIFPGAVINASQTRPSWIINVTNDAWYGHTSGPYQHLEMARVRAIEEGIPLVRAANSGVSAVFDAYGQMVGSLGLGKKGVLDVFLPPPIQSVPFYAQWGDKITFALILGVVMLAWIFSLKSRKNE